MVPFKKSRLLGTSAGQPVYALFEAERPTSAARAVFEFGAPVLSGKAGPLSQIAVQTSPASRQFVYVDARGRLFELADAKTKSLMLIVYKPVKRPITLDAVTTVCVGTKQLGTFEEITRSGVTKTVYRRQMRRCPAKLTGAVAIGNDAPARLPSTSSPPSVANVGFYSCLSGLLFSSAAGEFEKATHFSSAFAGLVALPDGLSASFNALCANTSLISLSNPVPAPKCPGPACAYQPPPVPLAPAAADCATGTFNAPGQTCTVSVPYNAGAGNTNFTAATSNAQIVTVSPESGTVTGSGNLHLIVTAGSLGGSASVTVSIGTKQTAFPFDNAWTSSGAPSPIASVAFQLPSSQLPFGQTMTFAVSAQSADGQTITGTYDHPIALTATNMTVSPSSVSNSAQASRIAAAWNYTFAGTSGSITASADGKSATVIIKSATANPHSPMLFVVNDGSSEIDAYAIPLGSNAVPALKVTNGVNPNLFDVAFDRFGNLFSVDLSANVGLEFSPPYTAAPATLGNVASSCRLFVGAGNFFLAPCGTPAVTELSPPYTGTPVTLGAANGLSGAQEGMTVDSQGDLFVVDCAIATGGSTTCTSSGDIREYRAPITDSSQPVLSIPPDNSPIDELLAFDSAGNLFAVDRNAPYTVRAFAPPYTGAPFAVISNAYNSTYTTGGAVNAIAIDAHGDLFLAGCCVGIVEYAPPYTSATATFDNPCCLNIPAMAVSADGKVYVYNWHPNANGPSSGDSVLEFTPPFSNTSQPTATVCCFSAHIYVPFQQIGISP